MSATTTPLLLPVDKRNTHDAVLRAMTSADVLSGIVANFVPPPSSAVQAWLATLAGVHSSWAQPVAIALRQHPIISSIAQLLSLQNSLRSVPLAHQPGTAPHPPPPAPVPAACALRSLLLNLYPTVTHPRSHQASETAYQEKLSRQLQLAKELYLDPAFFGSLSNLSSIHLSMIKLSITNFSFLLSSLAPSLSDLGLHNIHFIALQDTRPIFQAIFTLPHLKSLSLTGQLATHHAILPILSNPSTFLNAQISLQALSLSDEGLTSSGPSILRPWDLLHCWESCAKAHPINNTDDQDPALPLEIRNFNTKYSSPLNISSYRVCTNHREWYEPFRVLYLKAITDLLGIQLAVTHHSQPVQMIKWMSGAL